MRGFRLTPDAQSDLLDIRRFTVILNRAYKAAKKSRLKNTKLAYQALLVLRDHYVPMHTMPSMQVERKVLEQCPLAVIQIEPAANPPVRYQGRVWVKVGPTVQAATAEEEQRLTERRRAGDAPCDRRTPRGSTRSIGITCGTLISPRRYQQRFWVRISAHSRSSYAHCGWRSTGLGRADSSKTNGWKRSGRMGAINRPSTARFNPCSKAPAMLPRPI